jgi:hypothetical protein
MRRSSAAVAVLALILAIGPSAQPVTASYDATPAASGTFTWGNVSATIVGLPDGSTVSSGAERLTWTGTFMGQSSDVYQMVTTPPASEGVDCCGPGYGTETAVFRGRVAGAAGKLIVYLTYYWQAGTGPRMHHGTWTILSGTGALEDLTRSGTWTRYSDGSQRATYTGRIARS